MDITAYQLAERFLGVREGQGSTSNPQVLSMLRLDDQSITDDETAWCSAFVNYIAWMLRLPRSKSLAARSWLQVGTPVELKDATKGFTVAILSRGTSPLTGHVGWLSAFDGTRIWLLGGNQGDMVSVAPFDAQRVLGVRSLV